MASRRVSGKTWRVRDGSGRGRLGSLRNTNGLADGKDACPRIFNKNKLFEKIAVNIVDKSFDGILGIQLRHKITDFTFIVVSCYLAPENSPWSNSTQFC